MTGSCSPSSVANGWRAESASGPWPARRGRRDGALADRLPGSAAAAMRSWSTSVQSRSRPADGSGNAGPPRVRRGSGCRRLRIERPGRPARSGSTWPVRQPPASATSAVTSIGPGPTRSRGGRRRRPGGPGQPLERGRMTVRPSGPPSSAPRAGSNEAATGRPIDLVARDVRQVCARRRPSGSPSQRQQSVTMNSIRSPTTWATAFSRASRSASRIDVGRDDLDLVEHPPAAEQRRPGDRDRAGAVPTSTTRTGGLPGGRGAASNRVTTSASARSTSRSVSGRGIRARASWRRRARGTP